jgi:hypothetical protein
MAEPPDIWPVRWPEPPLRTSSSALTPVRPIGDRVPRFGVAQELDSPRQDDGRPASPRPVNRQAPPPAPSRDGAWANLCTWWACREVHPGDLWHRLQCHFGRHQVEGGRQIQLGSRFVRTERRCVWCGRQPG